MPYIGRFAPTPTGPLHFGSLVAALASYLDSKANNGQWLLRIEDLDPPRENPEASELIPKQLKAHGLLWDGDIQFQSHHHQRYEDVLSTLKDKGLLFPCNCSRKDLASHQGLHHGVCKSTHLEPHALRFLVENKTIHFNDTVYGKYQQSLTEVGDQILKRKDHLYSYQLAVLVDDFHARVTHVVRGVDLLDNTPRQIHLLQQLGWPVPLYLHIPLITNESGQKLSKQNQAKALNLNNPVGNLILALSFLNQALPPKPDQASAKQVLSWAIQHWQPLLITPSTNGVLA
jgi:glutamyl-Q tRNA(Asp) synthetase